MRIDQEVLVVLSQSTVKGRNLILPPLEDRKLYLKTNTVVEAMGGRWDRRAKAHVFTEEPADALDRALSEGEISTPQEDGFFRTPDKLATRLVEMADIRAGMNVLEPSAGDGALMRAIYAAAPNVFVAAFELDHDRWKTLAKAAMANRFESTNQDFLEAKPPYLRSDGAEIFFDRVVMNPPFARQQDIAHVTHAMRFLRPEGVLVSVMSAGVMFREDRRASEFRAMISAQGGVFESLPEKSFAESGTDVRTIVVKVRKTATSVDTGRGPAVAVPVQAIENNLQERAMTTTEVVPKNGKSNGKNGTAMEAPATEGGKPALPKGLAAGGTLFKADENKVKLGDHDPGCQLADGDPLKNRRRMLSDAELGIPELVSSMLATRTAVVVYGTQRGEDVWITKGNRRTRALRIANRLCKEKSEPPIGYFVILESGDPQKLAASAFADDFNRFDTPPLMQAQEFKRLIDTQGWTPNYLGSLIGKTGQSVKNTLSLLKLIEPAQKLLELGPEKNGISVTVAYQLANRSPEKQAEALKLSTQSAAANAAAGGKGKVRVADVRTAVAKAEKNAPKASDAPKTDAPAASSRPKPKPTGTLVQHTPPTASQWRKLLAGIARGEKEPEGDGVILPKDPDFVKVKQAMREDPVLFMQVVAGEVSHTRIPGLKKCFAWVGVELTVTD